MAYLPGGVWDEGKLLDAAYSITLSLNPASGTKHS
jgi:hypothetical protein